MPHDTHDSFFEDHPVVTGLLIGAAVEGAYQANDYQRSQLPPGSGLPWSRRHPFLALALLWLACVVSLIVCASLIYFYALGWDYVPMVFGETYHGLIGLILPFVVCGTVGYIRAERRWGPPKAKQQRDPEVIRRRLVVVVLLTSCLWFVIRAL